MYEYALVHDHQVKIFILPKSLIGQYFYLIKVALKAWLNKSYVILLDGDNFFPFSFLPRFKLICFYCYPNFLPDQKIKSVIRKFLFFIFHKKPTAYGLVLT